MRAICTCGLSMTVGRCKASTEPAENRHAHITADKRHHGDRTAAAFACLHAGACIAEGLPGGPGVHGVGGSRAS